MQEEKNRDKRMTLIHIFRPQFEDQLHTSFKFYDIKPLKSSQKTEIDFPKE